MEPAVKLQAKYRSNLPTPEPTSNVALIVGCGSNVMEDICGFRQQFPHIPTSVWAINDIGMFLTGRVEHCVCIESALLNIVRYMRTFRRMNRDFIVHALEPAYGVQVCWSFNRRIPRNSGMLTIAAALNYGHSKAVLAGIPMDDQGHFYDDLSVRGHYSNYVHVMERAPWIGAIDTLKDQVRSMSGLTRKRWGYPTAEWLEETPC